MGGPLIQSHIPTTSLFVFKLTARLEAGLNRDLSKNYLTKVHSIYGMHMPLKLDFIITLCEKFSFLFCCTHDKVLLHFCYIYH